MPSPRPLHLYLKLNTPRSGANVGGIARKAGFPAAAKRKIALHLFPNDQDCSAFMELLLCAESSTFEEIVTQNRKSQSNSVLKNYGKSMLCPIMSLHFRLHQRGS